MTAASAATRATGDLQAERWRKLRRKLAPWAPLLVLIALCIVIGLISPNFLSARNMVRIAEPRYYGGDVRRRDAAVATLAGQGCRLLVFGRREADRFVTLRDIAVPAALRALCDAVPEAEFRADISSTELRREG